MAENREEERLPAIVMFAMILASLTGGLIYYLWHFEPNPAMLLAAFGVPIAFLIVGGFLWWNRRNNELR